MQDSQPQPLLALKRNAFFAEKAYRSTLVFIAGFALEAVTLARVDSLRMNVKQILLMLAAYLFIRWEIRESKGLALPVWVQRLWKHRDSVISFLLGGLLCAYFLLFFKSASFSTSILFLGFLCALVILNEFFHIPRLRIDFHLVLFSTTFTSFWIILIPMLMGTLRPQWFYTSILISLASLQLLFWDWLKSPVPRGWIPLWLPPLLLLAFYQLQWIPPAPLHVKSIGVYRSIERKEGSYVLTHLTPRWKFWKSGDQEFLARPGDQLVLFMRVFAPTHFSDELKVVFHPAGRPELIEEIPLVVIGGREDGFRGYVRKVNYAPGKWIASLRTYDQREVARLPIEIREDLTPGERKFLIRKE